MKYKVTFSQSEALAESLNSSLVMCDDEFVVESEEFVQITYEGLRSGPEGEDLAFINEAGLWYAVSGRQAKDGEIPSRYNRGKLTTIGPFSDITIVGVESAKVKS